MALHFDYSDCAMNDATELGGEELSEDGRWSIINTFIWQTIFIGMNTITEANKEEFFERCAFYEKVLGVRMFRTDEAGEAVEFPITREMVDLMVGLRTNASPWTKAKFRNHIHNCFVRELPKAKVSA